jgi:hypothetical protein
MDFIRALKAGGCNAALAVPIPGLRPDIMGVSFGVRDLHNIDVEAQKLDSIIGASKIKFHVSPVEPNFYPGEPFVLVIGARG